ncbi:MAG: antibiotic biosynthesis monooxygenase [Taibaiella sp.]|nr:antibiotic biosynthesis monooxygenase [Taibaiella sp.]
MFLLQGKLRAQPGHHATLTDILLQAARVVEQLRGCNLYAVSHQEGNREDVFITEIWSSKDAHDLSLEDEEVRKLIRKAMPLLASIPEEGLALNVLGGHGV